MSRGRDDLEGLRPYLELAREIRAEVDRIAAGGPGSRAGLDAALDAVPTRERQRVARAVFDRLPAEQQWAVIERVFGDEQVRTFLADARQGRLDEIERRSRDLAIARVARSERRLDLGAIPEGTELRIGLFRPAEVDAAIGRGSRSASCARRLVVRATGADGLLRLLEDVFDPGRSFFVTSDYDERVWHEERLDGHQLVRLGAAPTGAERALEPVLYPGGRVDVEVAATVRPGRLHLGFVLVGDEDVFATTS